MEFTSKPREVVRGMTDPKEAWEALITHECLPEHMTENPRRLFALAGSNIPSPHPLRISQAVTIAEGLADFLAAEEVALEMGVALAGINRWWHDMGYRPKDYKSTVYPIQPPEHILWEDKDEKRDRLPYSLKAMGWSQVATALTLAEVSLPDDPGPRKSDRNTKLISALDRLASAWESDRHRLIPWRGLADKSINECLARYLESHEHYDTAYPLRQLPNPLRPLHALLADHHHGKVEIGKQVGKVPWISIGYNVL